MIIRRFSLRDLPLLPRYRSRGLFLDSTRVFIHGPIMVPMGALVSFLGPSLRIFTYYCENRSEPGKPILGQVTYSAGASYARLSFIAPEEALEQAEMTALAEYVIREMGQLGVLHILADVDETNPVFEMLHRAGFAIYARQRIWRLDGEPRGERLEAPWRASHGRDSIGVHSLYCDVVPGLVQQVEPLPKRVLSGVVYYEEGELQAFVELKYGRKGIWVQPFVHPDAAGFERRLVDLLQDFPNRHDRPLYICVRSYQSWLEAAVEAMGAVPGPQQAVMVRHLAIARRVNQSLPLAALNGKRIEPSAPAIHMERMPIWVPSEAEKHARIDSVR